MVVAVWPDVVVARIAIEGATKTSQAIHQSTRSRNFNVQKPLARPSRHFELHNHLIGKGHSVLWVQSVFVLASDDKAFRVRRTEHQRINGLAIFHIHCQHCVPILDDDFLVA